MPTATKEAPTKKKYRLKRGMHTEGSRKAKSTKGEYKVYVPGDIVTTATDLVAKFGKEKFDPIYAEANDDGLQYRSVENLRHIAEENEVEIDLKMDKGQLIDALRKAKSVT